MYSEVDWDTETWLKRKWSHQTDLLVFFFRVFYISVRGQNLYLHQLRGENQNQNTGAWVCRGCGFRCAGRKRENGAETESSVTYKRDLWRLLDMVGYSDQEWRWYAGLQKSLRCVSLPAARQVQAHTPAPRERIRALNKSKGFVFAKDLRNMGPVNKMNVSILGNEGKEFPIGALPSWPGVVIRSRSLLVHFKLPALHTPARKKQHFSLHNHGRIHPKQQKTYMGRTYLFCSLTF